MRNLFLGLSAVLVMVSCSTDEQGMTVEGGNVISAEVSRTKQIGAANAANPYDGVGESYGAWLSDFYRVHGYSKAIPDLAAQLNYIGAKLKTPNFLDKSKILVTEDDISVIVSNPEVIVASSIDMGTLGEVAKSSLLDFFVSLIQEKEAQYSLFYDYIVAYEAGVIDSASLTAQEMETILGITSVTRYALDAEGGHKDRDWEISVGNRKVKSGFHPFQTSLISVIVHLPYYL